MSSGASGMERRGKDRIDLNRNIQLRFQKFQDFLTEIAGNISPGGMFVRSDDPHEAGEQFEFECSLADGYPLVSGRAEVVWTRRHALSVDQPSGMGVRFLELRDKSEMLIRRIVEQRVEAGEKPFELESAASEAAAGEAMKEPSPAPKSRLSSTPSGSREPEPSLATSPVAEKPPSPPKAPPATERPPAQVLRPTAAVGPSAPEVPSLAVGLPVEGRARQASHATTSFAPARSKAARSRGGRLGILRLLELLVFSILAGGCMILIFNQYWVRPRVDRLEARLFELTGDSRVGGPPGFARAEREAREQLELESGVAGAPAEVMPVSEAAATVESRETVQDAVRGWASAWSEQRVDDYLSYYATDFVPASGVPRPVWEGRRRERLLAQGAIRVAVVSLQIKKLSSDEARAMFTQSYQSSAYRDRVRKALRMSWIDGRWQIVEEVVIRQLPW